MHMSTSFGCGLKDMAKQLMALLDQQFPQRQFLNILEIGCGTGILTETDLSKVGIVLALTVIDLAEDMLSTDKSLS